MESNIWNPASKVLDFDAIGEKMAHKGFRFNFEFEDELRKIVILVDPLGSFGQIALVEFYTEEKGFYFLYWYSDVLDFNKENYIYKVNSETGRLESEGPGILSFEQYLTNVNLAKIGVPRDRYDECRMTLPPFFEKIISAINFEVKQTIRSNATDFILNI